MARQSNPITASQFLNAFHRTWFDSRHTACRSRSRRLPRRLGLAISGGADSMALAYLCRQWEMGLNQPDSTVMAFVVDHRAREESSREARTVVGWLADLANTQETHKRAGLKSHILPLTWPQGGSPSEVSAFETHARRLRFQALGQACRDNGIETLLMGHHQDDNVETTLWRLCTGARGAGLAGIPPVTGIPECHGLYGMSGSGLEMGLTSRPGGLDLDSYSGSNLESDPSPRNVTISTGGISICRPLLTFPKSNLVATCEANGVPFVTDKTNFDPTLTPRNAIRSLLAENRLPRALQPPSILSLIKASQDLLRDSTRLSNRLLRECRILELNLSAGTMTVKFPSETVIDEHVHSQDERDPTQRIRQIQALSLRRITEILSPFPENHFSLRGFEKFIDRVFLSTSQTQKDKQKQAFTLGGVLFKPLLRKGNREWDNTWLVSRQPFMRHRLPTLPFDISIPSPPASSSSPDQQKKQSQNQNQESNYTPWQLWDNRYWFRFALVPEHIIPISQLDSTHSSTPLSSPPSQTGTKASSSPPPSSNTKPPQRPTTENPNSVSLTLRPLQQSDLEYLRKSTLTSPSPSPSTSTSTSSPTSPTSPPKTTSTPPNQPPTKTPTKTPPTTTPTDQSSTSSPATPLLKHDSRFLF
ncbi:adenine nucleotide alpha hydrolases-like protein [Aspergillus campestris IBT 28561]|uniref:tRNA(Ile)-lysidine synthetase n=1 Tax=Aspergillus campestris (strain IBT 28561) TaxID=1392248 RepID=A0A2I1D169_ASPC2|nr:adenine nucleotide alpha hydrolases-like protein [Aspergillus campestris IBT 28561]PKY03617.1 adenine nucleotide alpha hydrolases-like protein [Aspergillus campestris IBT 28561]